MTKRNWEENETLELDSVEECLNRPAVTSQQPTVDQEVSHSVGQPATEGGTPNWVDVATIATSAAYKGDPPNWPEGVTTATSATDEDELLTCTQVATIATSAVPVDTSHNYDEVADAATSAAKEGEYGPLWALLAHAGYTIWDQ